MGGKGERGAMIEREINGDGGRKERLKDAGWIEHW